MGGYWQSQGYGLDLSISVFACLKETDFHLAQDYLKFPLR